jgi:glycine dehydrogenase subunit 1
MRHNRGDVSGRNGKQGLRQVADLCLGKAHYLAEELKKLSGYGLAFPAQFFHEFVVKTPEPPASINQRLFTKGIIGGLDLGRFDPDWAGNMLISVTEKRTRNEMDAFVAVLRGMA